MTQFKKDTNIYLIPFKGLANGEHFFNFDIDTDIFHLLTENTFKDKIQNALIKINLQLQKQINFLQLDFFIDGYIQTDCDRCTSFIKIKLFEEFKMMIKMTNNPEEYNTTNTDPEMFYINYTDFEIDVKPWLIEFIFLSIPDVKKCGSPGKMAECNQHILKMIL